MERSTVTLAERLAARRRELGLRQQDLADVAGVSKAAVSQWELGHTQNLKLDNLFRIADRLKVHARWLALGQGPKFVAVLIALGLPPFLAQAIDAARQMACVLCQIVSFETACARARTHTSLIFAIAR